MQSPAGSDRSVVNQIGWEFIAASQLNDVFSFEVGHCNNFSGFESRAAELQRLI